MSTTQSQAERVAPRYPTRRDVIARQYWKTPPLDRLSRSEVRVMALAAQGLTNAEVAAELFLSVNTIKTHLARSYDKLAVSTKAHAVAVLMFDERFRDLVRGDPERVTVDRLDRDSAGLTRP